MIPSGAIALWASRPSRRATCLDGSSGISVPVEQDAAGARLEHPRQRAQQRRLAAGVRADDRGEAALGDLDVEPVGDDALVVGEGDAWPRAELIRVP